MENIKLDRKKKKFLLVSANDLSLERKQRGQSKRITTSPVEIELESNSNKSVRIYPPTSTVRQENLIFSHIWASITQSFKNNVFRKM